VSNLKTAPLIQKRHVCKISISVYLRLLETVYIQIYIYEVKLKTGAKPAMFEMSAILSDINQNCNYVLKVYWVTAVIISQKNIFSALH